MKHHTRISLAGTVGQGQRIVDSRRGSCSRVRSRVCEDRADDVHNSSSVCRRRRDPGQADVPRKYEARWQAGVDLQGMSVRSS